MRSLERWLTALSLVLLSACGSGTPAPSLEPAPGPEATPAAAPGPEATPAPGETAASPVRLYALDCGRADIQDMTYFGDDGGPRSMVVPCYVIRHPRGTMLWDTGVGDEFAKTKEGVLMDKKAGIRFSLKTPLRDLLGQLGLTPADVPYVAFSHLHVDHAGNANMFPDATWILDRRELAWATKEPAPAGYNPAQYTAHRSVKTKLLDGETDLFGDGAVTIIPTPGHTPGHQSLILKLQRAGTVIFSGDACHTHGNWEHRRTPPFNTDREESVKSMDRLAARIGATHARFLVQHEPDDFAKLPRFPAYLD